MPFNFELIDNINVNSTPADYKENIDNWIDAMPKDSSLVPNWVVGNHDQHRVVNRFGLYRGDAINMLVQVLPGKIDLIHSGRSMCKISVIPFFRHCNHIQW